MSHRIHQVSTCCGYGIMLIFFNSNPVMSGEEYPPFGFRSSLLLLSKRIVYPLNPSRREIPPGKEDPRSSNRFRVAECLG